MGKYRILAVDGGGIRGIIPATVIQHLNQTPGLEGWLEQVDLFVGTSTGGIIALALAAGIDIHSVAALYRERGPAIFAGYDTGLLVRLQQFFRAAYNNRVLERELRGLFGEMELGKIGKHVAVCAFHLFDEMARSWKPKVFHNFEGEDSDGERLAALVALYSSAGPTFFPTVDGYIDGGVFANNPSMVAVAQALDARKAVPGRGEAAEPPQFEDLVLLSLGTGAARESIGGTRLNWGLRQWAPRIISVMMEGATGVAHFQCQQLLGAERYHRYQITFPEGTHVGLDAVGRVHWMEDQVVNSQRSELTELVYWMQRHW